MPSNVKEEEQKPVNTPTPLKKIPSFTFFAPHDEYQSDKEDETYEDAADADDWFPEGGVPVDRKNSFSK